jgi:signal peptidase I
MTELQIGSLTAPQQRQEPRSGKILIRILLFTGLALASLGGFFLVRFLLWAQCFQFRGFRVSGGSMCPAICENERFFVGLDAFNSRSPRRGDVIMFEFDASNASLFTKRVIGIAGDTIARGPANSVLINGNPLVLPQPCGSGNSYEHLASVGPPFDPVKVPNDSLFVIGDNLDNSYDSRFFGVVPLAKVRGKALLIYSSPNPSRIFCRIQ